MYLSIVIGMSGWERSVDPSTGREFWLNHATHETSWTPPAESASSLPPGWEERRDAQGRVFFIDHNRKTTTWVDPRRGQSASGPASSTSAHDVSAPQPSATNDDEALARWLQEQEDQAAPVGGMPSSSSSNTSSISVAAPAPPAASGGMTDEELARMLQDEENSAARGRRSDSGSLNKADKADTNAKLLASLAPADHAGWLLTRREHRSLGWKKVFARLHGSTLALYRDDKTGSPETELSAEGASGDELEKGQGKVMSKGGAIFRFRVIANAANAKCADTTEEGDGGSHDFAAKSEQERCEWLAHLVVGGARTPAPAMLCKWFMPLLRAPPSDARAAALGALANVLQNVQEKSSDAVAPSSEYAAALVESGAIKSVASALASSPGQEEAARCVYFAASESQTHAALQAAGAIPRLNSA